MTSSGIQTPTVGQRCSSGMPRLCGILAVLAASAANAKAESASNFYDAAYFLPQEFLLDLPLRKGSFAQKVMDTFKSADIPDVHDKNVDSGFLSNTYADSDFNSNEFKSQRSICTQVPPGGNPYGDGSLCEREGALAPRAVIEEPRTGEVGRFRLQAQFEFRVPGNIHIWEETCVIWCWRDTICDDDVAISGTMVLTSTVVVTSNPEGTLSLKPTTNVVLDPSVSGCHSDWLAGLFVDADDAVQDQAEEAVQSWVQDNLQSQMTLSQNVQLGPNLRLTYKFHSVQFVASPAGTVSGYVHAYASCTVYATAPNGTTQVFPDPSQPWTGSHRLEPLNGTWIRTSGTGAAQKVLLGCVSFAAELLTMVLRGQHYSGALTPKNQSTVKDAVLFSNLDMSQPTVEVSGGNVAAVLRELSLRLRMSCLDREATNASARFPLLDASFSNTTQDLQVSAYVAADHSAMGLKLQVQNVSLADANLTFINSSAFFGTPGQLKALAVASLRNSLPQINRQLNRTPIIFCNSSTCALVPFAPHPEVRTVLRGAGYFEITWHCQCGGSDTYERCQGFSCPEGDGWASKPTTRTTQHMRLASRRLLGQRPSTQESQRERHGHDGGLFMSAFPGGSCSFDPGSSLTVFAVKSASCQSEDLPPMRPAFRLTQEGNSYLLAAGCDKTCESCAWRQHLSPKASCAGLPGFQVMLSDPNAPCIGGDLPYPNSDLVLLANTSTDNTRLSVTRLSGPTPCGLHGDLFCSASKANASNRSLHVWLFCTDSSLQHCLLSGIRVPGGWWPLPSSQLGRQSGFTAATITTSADLPLLQACVANHPTGNGAWLWLLWVALVALLFIAFSAAIGCFITGWWRGARRPSWFRGWPLPRLWCIPPSAKDRVVLARLATAVLLIGACAATWVISNPLVGLLKWMEENFELKGFDTAGAEHIVQASRWRGLTIFCFLALVLMLLGLTRTVRAGVDFLGLCQPRPGPPWAERTWRFTAAGALFEGTSGVALLAVAFWQQDFANAYKAEKSEGGDIGFLSGSVAATTSAVFSIRLVLVWVGPFLMSVRIASVASNFTAAYYCSRAAGRSTATLVRPYLLGLLLTHEVMALILAITYFHSGYISVEILMIVLAGALLDASSFAFTSDRTHWPTTCTSHSTLLVSVLVTLQAGLCAALGYALGDVWLKPFLLVTSLTTAYVSWAAVTVMLETEASGISEPLEMGALWELAPSTSQASIESRRSKVVQVSLDLWGWLFESREGRDATLYGKRIKWRRACLLLGTCGLALSTLRAVDHAAHRSPWDDFNDLLFSMVGPGCIVSHQDNSFLTPLVDRYGEVRQRSLFLQCCGAASFGLAALLDILGSRRGRCALSALQACRLCGVLGSAMFAAAQLVFNSPDYVGLLDFHPTLGHCGSQFCGAVADSIRAALGSGLLAKAGVDFLPLLVSLPWTLFRIGFFLAEDAGNTQAVSSLMWATLMCIFRISLLPATAAYVYRPDIRIVVWYAAFLLLPTALMFFIVLRKKRCLLWYFLWGWGVFLVPLLGMATVALQEDVLTLASKMWDTIRTSWPSLLAEFTLSDVVVSDLYFMLLNC